MAENIEEKWPKGLVASIAFGFILVLMLATAAPNKLVDKVMVKERAWGLALLGQSDLAAVESKTREWYTFLLLDSGAKAMVADVFIGERSSKGTVDALEEKAGWWFSYLSERGEALQKIIYQVVYRVVMALFWLPFLAVVVVPGAYAGWMRWHAKRAGFSYTSPFVNNHATNMLLMSTVLLPLSLIFPLPLPPLVVSTFLILVIPILLSLLISNLPKKF
ncbi:DUF4400 domain-containing protein [Pseudomonas nitroreducens]|uniref:DUF4400 domain-containing protein n=1 Tax=Pseudomonas nitroreducens TaxID=46680 RepID=A0ABS0KQ26_PSENT|nr:DUF4400 domain-containing protein [Pseudomonas nitroreducens]MBG6289445.1 DUF4400 domain-containing protein [Pseudomonas nitroreducens]MDG9857317.1 DUF4400 domain-containing protein [Pseudomonas nitroreducens]MDH1076589.1 DUF4400 domain-containing protein [Pseudomonas nitroreducens]